MENGQEFNKQQNPAQERMNKSLNTVEDHLIHDGNKLNNDLSAVEKLIQKYLETDINVRRSYKIGSPEYVYGEMLYSRKHKLEEEKEKWEIDVSDLWAEKTLLELGKGEEINEKTSLILNKQIDLISKKTKQGYRLDLLAQPSPFQHMNEEDKYLEKLSNMSLIDLQNTSRREAMRQIHKALPPEEIKKYDKVFQKTSENFNTKIIKYVNK